jgi:hypothetical protein
MPCGAKTRHRPARWRTVRQCILHAIAERTGGAVLPFDISSLNGSATLEMIGVLAVAGVAGLRKSKRRCRRTFAARKPRSRNGC